MPATDKKRSVVQSTLTDQGWAAPEPIAPRRAPRRTAPPAAPEFATAPSDFSLDATAAGPSAPVKRARAPPKKMAVVAAPPPPAPAPVAAEPVRGEPTPILTLEDAFRSENVPRSWASAIEDARYEIDYAVKTAGEMMDKVARKGCRPGLIPAAADVLAPLRGVSPREVRAIVFVPDPSNEHSVGLGPGTDGTKSRAMMLLHEAVLLAEEEATGEPSARTFESGSLNGWARQGILLLTMNLTAHEGFGTKNTHALLWLGFYYHILQAVRAHNKRIPILLWGAPDIMKMEMDASCVLIGPNPSAPGGDDASAVRRLAANMIKVNAGLSQDCQTALRWWDCEPGVGN